MPVDAGIVGWLKDGLLYASSTDEAIAAAWGTDARESEITSCIATFAGATAEAARQQGFLKGPIAVEVVTGIKGQRVDLIGRAVTIVCDRLGYNNGLTVFVIGAEEQDGTDRTTLTVLRRL